jgi:hypothetical protein
MLPGSSFQFACHEDEWDFVNGETRRTLVSGKLIDVGPTSTPAYEDSSVTVLRSLAANRGADLDDVTRDFQNGNLARYFTRSDRTAPTPLAVAQRSADESPMSVRYKQLELMRRKMEWDTPKISTQQAQLELMRRKMIMDDDGSTFEVRTLDGRQAQALLARRAPNGDFVDWHPAQR